MMMRRQTDEQDSTVALWGNYLLCGLILGLLFVTDWYFQNDVLSETLVGHSCWRADRLDCQHERLLFPVGS